MGLLIPPLLPLKFFLRIKPHREVKRVKGGVRNRQTDRQRLNHSHIWTSEPSCAWSKAYTLKFPFSPTIILSIVSLNWLKLDIPWKQPWLIVTHTPIFKAHHSPKLLFQNAFEFLFGNYLYSHFSRLIKTKTETKQNTVLLNVPTIFKHQKLLMCGARAKYRALCISCLMEGLLSSMN